MLFTLFKGKYPHCKEERRVRDYMPLFKNLSLLLKYSDLLIY